MLALGISFGVWAVLTILLLVWISRDYGDGGVSTGTALLLWTWHALNYALLILAAALAVWPFGVAVEVAVSAGVALVLIGLAVIAAGFYEFRSVQRLSGTQTDQVIDSGIYRYSRHPQYVGIILTVLGIAVLGRSLAALAFAAALSVGFLLYLPMEERYVERSLGEPYRRYRERTPRILGLPRRSSAV